MTRYVMFKGTIYDTNNGSLEINAPIYHHNGYDVWSAEALLCEIGDITETTVIKPFYFMDVIG